jgi:hypothetical protein
LNLFVSEMRAATICAPNGQGAIWLRIASRDSEKIPKKIQKNEKTGGRSAIPIPPRADDGDFDGR